MFTAIEWNQKETKALLNTYGLCWSYSFSISRSFTILRRPIVNDLKSLLAHITEYCHENVLSPKAVRPD